jgi:hypothetical protein
MKKIIYYIALAVLFAAPAKSQELVCNVQVVSAGVQGTNKQVFQTLQTAIYEFMNNTVWTNHVFGPDERIECNLMLNITEQLSADSYKGSVQIQSRRPVFNSSYNTVVLNYKDNDVQFDYVEFEPLEFNINSHTSNLTSLLAYYAYIVIGMDYDTFSPSGGDPFFNKAERIVNNAQKAAERGWKAFESSSRKNRYWLVQNILDSKYSKLRDFMYQYHRKGLDMMDENVDRGRSNILESLTLLEDIYKEKPDPFMYYLQIILDAKSDEFVQVFSEAPTAEKNRAFNILTEIDPANSNKYDKIRSSN